MAPRKYSSGNELIKGCVILIDFIIMNMLLVLAAKYFSGIYPKYFTLVPRITLIMANISMIISQSVIGVIIHRRRTTFEEVFLQVVKLCLLQVSIMFVCLRLIGESGGMFRFMVLFLIVEIFVILCSRLIEKLFIRLFRQAGRNTRSVIFIGNDPSILMLYKNLISDSSTGYKVMGYYADADMDNKMKIDSLHNAWAVCLAAQSDAEDKKEE